jgi:hypothetical protein
LGGTGEIIQDYLGLCVLKEVSNFICTVDDNCAIKPSGDKSESIYADN